MFSSESRIIKSVVRSLFLCAILGLIVTVTSCKKEESGKTGDATSSGKYKIVTTCGMVTDIVKVVAGDKATVTGLIPSGDDPHMFRTGRKDVQQLMEADVVFYSGLELEGRMADDFENVKTKGKLVVAVTQSIKKEYLRAPPEFEGHPDPHVWMDISAWSQAVDVVEKSLTEFDKPNAEYYAKNASEYKARLTELDAYCKKVIDTIPEDQRYLVTAHDAFGYFARAYGVKVKAVQGISTTSEAGIKDQNLLVDFIVAQKISAIFVESSVSQQNIKSVVNGCEDKGHTVKIGGELYSDAMGQDGTYEGTYIGMMDHNATRITNALGGTAPELGFQDKLTPDKKLD
jgi:manganese/zinc/iron transport system substrate-binding protein